MQRNRLSSLDLRAFLRSCHWFLKDQVTLDSWTAFQKFLLISEQTEFGLYVRQLKKLSPDLSKEIIDGFSNGQIESKVWLLETLKVVLPSQKVDIRVLGSWFGLLPRMLLWTFSDHINSIEGYDIDPRWESVARSLNEPETYSSRCQFFTRDMNELNYSEEAWPKTTVLINTSCEHLSKFREWFDRIHPGTLVVLQGNNFADPHEHHTIWEKLEDFKKDAPLSTLLFEGSLGLSKYDRFMIIGVK